MPALYAPHPRQRPGVCVCVFVLCVCIVKDLVSASLYGVCVRERVCVCLVNSLFSACVCAFASVRMTKLYIPHARS